MKIQRYYFNEWKDKIECGGAGIYVKYDDMKEAIEKLAKELEGYYDPGTSFAAVEILELLK